jgi:predicted hotdog family 3-hydroxylacyl-ACP dehydratase
MTQLASIADLIPHAGPMVLLDELTHWAEGEAVCTLRIREGTPFVRDGRVDGCTTIEHMAQCVAACLGYEALRGGQGVRVGMIIACKRFELFVPHLSVGDELLVRAKRIRGNDTLSHFDCTLERGSERVACAVLTLFHGERPPE